MYHKGKILQSTKMLELKIFFKIFGNLISLTECLLKIRENLPLKFVIMYKSLVLNLEKTYIFLLHLYISNECAFLSIYFYYCCCAVSYFNKEMR